VPIVGGRHLQIYFVALLPGKRSALFQRRFRHEKNEKIFVRNVRSSWFAVIFSIDSCGCCSAALFTRMSILPNSFTVF
jgi:hypothetical protein